MGGDRLRLHSAWSTLKHILRVCLADQRYTARQPLLEWLSDEEPILCEPLHELGLQRGLFESLTACSLARSDGQPVGRVELVCARADGDGSAFVAAGEDDALFHGPDPVGEETVEGKVDDDGGKGPVFGCFEAELVVVGKGDGADYDGRVAQGELDVGVVVGLGEVGERGEVVLEGIIRGVFAVWAV